MLNYSVAELRKRTKSDLKNIKLEKQDNQHKEIMTIFVANSFA